MAKKCPKPPKWKKAKLALKSHDKRPKKLKILKCLTENSLNFLTKLTKRYANSQNNLKILNLTPGTNWDPGNFWTKPSAGFGALSNITSVLWPVWRNLRAIRRPSGPSIGTKGHQKALCAIKRLYGPSKGQQPIKRPPGPIQVDGLKLTFLALSRETKSPSHGKSIRISLFSVLEQGP